MEADTVNHLGSDSAISQLLCLTARSYRSTIDLLEQRGTPAFGPISSKLYGRPDDPFHQDGPTVLDLADSLDATLRQMEGPLAEVGVPGSEEPTDFAAPEAVIELQARLDASMGPGQVNVRLDDGLVADAAAGSTYVKLRADARFSRRTLATLEAHEDWVHVGTTLNG
ncbi:MAG: DUF1704 domain-containing protein, partial [Actinomycetota bacterium]|nr:DUF1704 domain-containing protein [Actinomycetota bacterium]